MTSVVTVVTFFWIPSLVFLLLTLVVAPNLSGAETTTGPSSKPATTMREVRAGRGSTVPAGTLIRAEHYYIDETGRDVLEGTSIEYYPDGKKRIESTYRNGLLDGDLVEWSGRTGRRVREEHWIMGVRNGAFVEYHDNGTKASETAYREGRITGSKKFFNRRGQIIREEKYEAGNPSEVTTYYESGHKKSHGHLSGFAATTIPGLAPGSFAHLKKDGKWTYWDEHGRVVAEGVFKDGEPWEGICGTVKREGSIVREEWARYREGKLAERLADPMTQEER